MEQKQITGPVKAERWKRKTQSFEHTEGLLESLGFADWTDLPRIISIVGAGGKTSTMYDLAEELAKKGARVLITTSTHIAKPKQYDLAVMPKLADLDVWMRSGNNTSPDRNVAEAGDYADGNSGEIRKNGGRILAAGKQAEGPNSTWKLTMPEDLGEESVMQKLLKQFDVILIEADGSKRLR